MAVMRMTGDEMNEKDDSLERWDSTNAEQKKIWDYYDQNIAKKIVQHALEHENLTLKDLYHALSIARANCELEKNISYASSGQKSMDFMRQMMSDWHDFQPGGTIEPNVEKWGDTVNELFKKRLTNNPWGKRGLSLITPCGNNTKLEHPKGFILERLEPTFQQLINTDNFFEFLTLSSHMMYGLSNYPPVVRGSAAINTWIIDEIARKKFGLVGSLRPLLFDWTAFLETPENYTAFYTISAAANYLAMIPELSQSLQELCKKIPVLMKEDPNQTAILNEREQVWKELQTSVKTFLENSTTLPENQRELLSELAKRQILFRHQSTDISQCVNKIQGNVNINEIIDILDNEFKENPLLKEQFKQLIELHNQLPEIFLESYKDKDLETKLNENWANLEILRPIYFIDRPKLQAFLGVGNLKRKITENNHEPIPVHLLFLAKASFASAEEIKQLPQFLIGALSEESVFSANLKEAIYSGGVRFKDLIDKTKEQIEQISSPEAILLYRENLFIHAPDVLNKTDYFCSKMDNLKDNQASITSEPNNQKLNF